MNVLELHVPQFTDVDCWDWRLTDTQGGLIAYHQVSLDRSDRRFDAFHSLHRYVRDHADQHRRADSEAELVEEVGRWIASEVLGDIAGRIAEAAREAPLVVRVPLSEQARSLANRPLELAYVGDKPLALQDVSFAFEPEGTAAGEKAGVGERLRMLAIFSVPTDESVLNLRRERHELRRRIRHIALARGKAIELRILQYGATREVVARVLREEDGWDIVHFSGHGQAGGLVLEDALGARDPVPTQDVVELLWPGRRQLKLMTLSACDSAAATAAEILRELGIDPPVADEDGDDESFLPAVAHGLVRELGCAVVAMRYPVADDFAIALGAELYTGLIEQENVLPRALQFALAATGREALQPGISPYAVATPALFGPQAVELRFRTPEGQAVGFRGQIPDFPEEPEQFIGRVGPLARANKAFGRDSEYAGVLFCGMAGAGKSSCALELAYRHQQDRFPEMAWYKAPASGDDIHTALGDFARALERRLDGLEMAHAVENAERLSRFLPELKAYLESNSVLVVIDNLESLLTEQGSWKDDRWRLVIETLTSHRGPSRVILTSRSEPSGLGNRVLQEPITALSLNESVLLARELSHLGELMRSNGGAGRELVVRALRLVQGNPKLIMLADAQATDNERLQERLEDAEQAWSQRGDQLGTFFERGESSFDPEDFLTVLKSWTRDVVAHLDEAPRLLFQCLCALDEADRVESIMVDRLPGLWQRLDAREPAPALADAVEPLCSQGLVEREDGPGGSVRFRIHPAVAEAGQDSASRDLHEAVDTELATYWKQEFWSALSAPEEHGSMILMAGMRAAPYLLDLRDWETASALLEQVIARDTSQRTLALLVPLLERVVEHTGGTESEIEARTVLAKALTHTRPTEAESLLSGQLPQALEAGDFELASGIAGELINLLRRAGRLDAAHALAEQKAAYSRLAGLGAWTRLVDDGWRLQLLQASGRDEAVLEETRRLREVMDGLAPESGKDEAVTHWYAKEAILDAARSAALGLERWELALELGGEVLASKQRRQASSLSKMRSSFNDYGPLIRLDRLADAEELLERCQRSFSGERYLRGQGLLRSALGHLARVRGDTAEGIRSEQLALREKYAVDSPESIATSHHNLGMYLGADGAAHLLAAAAIRYRIGDRSLGGSVAMLQATAAAERPGSFEALCDALNRAENLDLAGLWEGLPAHGTSGHEAVDNVLQMIGGGTGAAPLEAEAPQLNQIRVWVRQGRTNGWIERHLDPARASERAVVPPVVDADTSALAGTARELLHV